MIMIFTLFRLLYTSPIIHLPSSIFHLPSSFNYPKICRYAYLRYISITLFLLASFPYGIRPTTSGLRQSLRRICCHNGYIFDYIGTLSDYQLYHSPQSIPRTLFIWRTKEIKHITPVVQWEGLSRNLKPLSITLGVSEIASRTRQTATFHIVTIDCISDFAVYG